MTERTFRIHGPRGVVEHPPQPFAAERTRASPATTRRAADQVPVTAIMTRQVVCVFEDLGFDALLALMLEERLGCVPVVDRDAHPVGMVTKLDLVEHLAKPPSTPMPRVADVMMPLAIALETHATVAHAAALLAGEDMHHVMIVSDRRLVGIVSTMDLTRWVAETAGLGR